MNVQSRGVSASAEAKGVVLEFCCALLDWGFFWSHGGGVFKQILHLVGVRTNGGTNDGRLVACLREIGIRPNSRYGCALFQHNVRLASQCLRWDKPADELRFSQVHSNTAKKYAKLLRSFYT